MAVVTPLACATSVRRFTSIQAGRLRLSAAARLAAMDGALRRDSVARQCVVGEVLAFRDHGLSPRLNEFMDKIANQLARCSDVVVEWLITSNP